MQNRGGVPLFGLILANIIHFSSHEQDNCNRETTLSFIVKEAILEQAELLEIIVNLFKRHSRFILNNIMNTTTTNYHHYHHNNSNGGSSSSSIYH